MLANLRNLEDTQIGRLLDPLGTTMVTGQLKDYVRDELGGSENGVSIGFNFGDHDKIQRFDFQGIDWGATYLLSRVAFVFACLGLLFGASRKFHRFDLRERTRSAKENGHVKIQSAKSTEWKREVLPPIVASFGILSLIRVEFLMLIRKGTKWLWLPTLGLMIALAFTKLEIAHMMLLPILWFLQVSRWSDIATKETEHRIHYFSFASFRPLTRLLPAQLIAAVALAIGLAMPLIIRYALVGEWLPILSIVTGAILVLSLSVFLGLISGGKKLFEVVYFLLTYAHLNKAEGLDYFGGMVRSTTSITAVVLITAGFLLIGFAVRKVQMVRG